ncbi:MAG: N-succinylarginine dihydrolase [Actinomycetota bacterium]
MNLDGLVGPTHNYAGLSLGNRASMRNAGEVAEPKRAALQGLAKMRAMVDLGLVQGILPPPFRPDPTAVRALGFPAGATAADVAAVNPALVPLLMSASSMWAANAATVSPSADTADHRVHLTPANLSSTIHRSFEAAQTTRILRTIFADTDRFVVHDPLPMAPAFADEGAANHGRFAAATDQAGHQLFVFGRDHDEPIVSAGGFPRRQSRLAGELIARSHGVEPDRTVFVRQAAAAIDAGAFHNDVVAVVNDHVLFHHQRAFEDPAGLAAALGRFPFDVIRVEVPDAEVSLADAVASYLFNSQLVTLPDGSMTLIVPREVEETPSTAAYLAAAVADPANPISSSRSFDLRQSMRNGGGPACLRLRVVLTEAEQAAVRGRVLVGGAARTDRVVFDDLADWVDRHYREALPPEDLGDPALATEIGAGLAELERLLELPGLYHLD